MKRVILLTLGIIVVVVPFTWTYLLGFISDTHHTCIDDFDSNKIGLTKNSISIEESRAKGVFIKSIEVDKSEFALDSLETIQIENVWIESSWKYECLDTGLTVIPLDRASIVIALTDYQKLLEKEHHIMYNGTYAAFSGVLSLPADMLVNDTASLTVVNKVQKQTDRIKLTVSNSPGNRPTLRVGPDSTSKLSK